jgi:hypothetical protein
MNLKTLSDEVLLSQTKAYVTREREMTLQVLHHLKEVERRRLFASLGYSSLFDYTTRELGYCAASACRRIDAMRLLKEMPELEEKIEKGNLSLSTVARAQNFFKKEDVSTEQKIEVMALLENKSTREVEKQLLSLSQTPETHLQERIKPVTPTLSEVKFYAEDELLEDLEKLKGLLAHSHPGMTTGELVRYLTKLGLKKHDLAQQEVKTKATPAPNESVRYVSRPVARQVWKRDQSRCTWTDPKTGQKCGSTYLLQIDHRMPFALGGKTHLQNLRLLCFQHNQLEAQRHFANWMPEKVS